MAKKFNLILERNLAHHSGKFAAGQNVGLGDFIMAAYIGNFIMNDENPFSVGMKATLDDTPLFKAYCQRIMKEFPYLTSRGSVGPF